MSELGNFQLFNSCATKPHESNASRIIQKIENILIKSDKFHLPKKLPQGEGLDWEVVVVDATEITVERPKKTEKVL